MNKVNLPNNPAVLNERSVCTQFSEPVALYANTWNLHITKNHPEMVDSLPEIKSAIANPAYVAMSRPGPNEVYGDNLVVIGPTQPARSSRLHIFVESPAGHPTISSAMYSRKPHHGSVVWTDSGNDIRASYDTDSDVLYISKEEPKPAVVEGTDDGLIFRFSMADDTPCGVTVTSFHKLWSLHKDELATKVSSFLDVSKESAAKAVALTPT